MTTETEHRFQITKADDSRHAVFGFPYICEKDGVQVIDHSKEFITKDDLETAAYQFMLGSREGDEFHTTEVKAQCIESMFVDAEKLAAMGLKYDEAEYVGWWAGFHIDDDDLYEKAKDGTYPMMSIRVWAVPTMVEVA